jgi:hypothetical protein
LTTPVIFLPDTPCIVIVGPAGFSGSCATGARTGAGLAAVSSGLDWLAFFTGRTKPSPRTKPARKPDPESSCFAIMCLPFPPSRFLAV